MNKVVTTNLKALAINKGWRFVIKNTYQLSVLQSDRTSESRPVMGKNTALLVVSLLVVLLSQTPLNLSGKTEAQEQDLYWEDGWFSRLIHPTIEVLIGNLLSIPLKVECHSKSERHGFVDLQPGKGKSFEFRKNTFLVGGPPVYCYIKLGRRSRNFKAYDFWRDGALTILYTVNTTGLYSTINGTLSLFN